MRRLYIAGNWKMHKTTAEAVDLARAVVAELKGAENKLLVAPPFTALHAVRDVVDGTNIRLGAQNMASAESGAHTGEVSVHMLKDLGVQTVILGHSERRALYGEDDPAINRKVKLALAEGLEVILCVGETLEQRDSGKAADVVREQLDGGLSEVDEAGLGQVVIAYEPVWAIGTGKTATPDDADAMHCFIREWFSDAYSGDSAETMVIQYGGSVKPDNAGGLMSMEHIDGALVGGASLEAESFAAIARAAVSS